MVLIACYHNSYVAEISNPETYDRLYLKVILEEFPRILYQDKTTILRSYTRMTNPIDPFCADCIAEIINGYTSVGSSVGEAEQLIDRLCDKFYEVVDEIEQQRNNIVSEREFGRVINLNVDVQTYRDIRCANVQEFVANLTGARIAGLLDVEEYMPSPNPSAELLDLAAEISEMLDLDESGLLDMDEYVDELDEYGLLDVDMASPNPDDGVVDVDEYVEYMLTPEYNPAARWAVDELERVDITVNGDGVVKQDNCVVCLEGFSKEEKIVLVRLPCKHEFHQDCIVEWFRSSHICPICRFQLPSES